VRSNKAHFGLSESLIRVTRAVIERRGAGFVKKSPPQFPPGRLLVSELVGSAPSRPSFAVVTGALIREMARYGCNSDGTFTGLVAVISDDQEPIPSFSAFWRTEPSVLFISFAIFDTGVLALECCLSA
jgi:hypothetical protein